ncbi:MAG: hypothetical protein IM516_09300 [Pseudanabaena sp. M158S2SP1A06QC]|nr:hypothetical protein [Pseudanabaena sp. M158S2SP1A06QC]
MAKILIGRFLESKYSVGKTAGQALDSLLSWVNLDLRRYLLSKTLIPISFLMNPLGLTQTERIS